MCLVVLGREDKRTFFNTPALVPFNSTAPSFSAPNVRSTPNFNHSLQNSLLPRQSHAILLHVRYAEPRSFGLFSRVAIARLFTTSYHEPVRECSPFQP